MLLRVFRFYSLSKFQRYRLVLLTEVTMLHIELQTLFILQRKAWAFWPPALSPTSQVLATTSRPCYYEWTFLQLSSIRDTLSCICFYLSVVLLVLCAGQSSLIFCLPYKELQDYALNSALDTILTDQNINRNLQLQEHSTCFISNNLKGLNRRNVFWWVSIYISGLIAFSESFSLYFFGTHYAVFSQ